MRQTQQIKTPAIKPKQFPNKILKVENYFHDTPAIKASLASILDLSNSNGWHIIQAYLNETKQNLLKSLQELNANDPSAIMNLARIQDQIKYVDFLLTLPQLIIDSYNETPESVNLDPYSHS